MISTALRVILIAGSLFTAIYMMNRISIAKIQIRDSIFWIIFSLLLFILSIFPEIALWASELLGIISPMNFVLLVVIFTLVVQLFFQNIRISQMNAQLRKLIQHVALNDKVDEDTDNSVTE